MGEGGGEEEKGTYLGSEDAAVALRPLPMALAWPGHACGPQTCRINDMPLCEPAILSPQCGRALSRARFGFFVAARACSS